MCSKSVKVLKSFLICLTFCCGLLFNVPLSHCQFELTKKNVFELGKVELFSAEKYKDIITRQNSCTVYLTDFMFAEPMEGKFLIELTISFITSRPGLAEPSIKRYKAVFSDVIEVINENEVIELALRNKKLIENYNLSDVTDIKIVLRLVRTKDKGIETIMSLVSPLMDKVAESYPALKVLDNLLLNVQDPSKKEILMFHGDFRVPQNVFEYRRLKDTEAIPMLRNNEKFAILLEGAARIPKRDVSVVGNVFRFVNGITHYVIGEKVIEPDKAKYKGAVKLFFTKDATSLLPEELKQGLHEVDRDLENADLVDVNYAAKEVELKAKKMCQLAEFYRTVKDINEETYYSVSQFLKISNRYLDYVKDLHKSDPSQEYHWDRKFKTWNNSMDIKGGVYQFQAIGIRGIYKDKVAKIYLPYSLGDLLILSFFERQIIMHQALERKNDYGLARDIP